jgi:hypothetical protein
MSERYYSVVTGKDNFLANILDDETALTLAKDSSENEYIQSVNANQLVLTKIAMLLPNGQKVGILPFKELAFGADYVTVPAHAIAEIYLVNDNMAMQIRAALGGIALSK